MTGSSGNDFARQLAERNGELNPVSVKKFRSSAAPKGTKLRSGYQDRTQLRTSAEEDHKAVRVKALEDMVRLGQMDLETFEALRDEIVGGDVKDVHLVKGLDYKLLERVRRGEDVLADNGKATPTRTQDTDHPLEPEFDVDDEFQKLEQREIQTVTKAEKLKKGEMPPPPSIAGNKRTRDDILKEFKASRLAIAEKAKKPGLGPRFVKVGQKKEKSRTEKDEQGREILIIVDEEGRMKRKVKKPKAEECVANGHGLLIPDKHAIPLGMEVTPIVPLNVPAEEDDGDIFEGVGVDYDPLGAVLDDESDSNDSEEDGKEHAKTKPPETLLTPRTLESETSNMPPPPLPPFREPPSKMRNYFGESESAEATADNPLSNPLSDPKILAALKKASTINPLDSTPTNEEEIAKIARRKKMLDSHDRDAEDMDMGFGGSRLGDEEDGDSKRVKLSVWGADVGDGDEKGEGKSKSKRKRGPKKKKGDANSAVDVLKVMERRKGEVK